MYTNARLGAKSHQTLIHRTVWVLEKECHFFHQACASQLKFSHAFRQNHFIAYYPTNNMVLTRNHLR